MNLTATSGVPREQWKVLVVEDQTFVRTMIVHMLNRLGIGKILEASDGSEAIHQLKAIEARKTARRTTYDLSARQETGNDDIDCIVSDINMRPMNGLQLLQAIRTGQAGIERHAGVVMLTGLTDERFLAAALALDANSFALKPISANSLAERIQRVVSARHPIKAASDYAAVAIPGVDDTDDVGTVPTLHGNNPSGISPLEQPGSEPLPLKAVTWAELEPGDVFQDHFYTKDGTVIVPEGTRVSAALISALSDLSQIVSFRVPGTVLRAG